MPVSQVQHPELEQLTAFGLGLLSEADSMEIEVHLGDCDECRQKLEDVPGDSLVDLLQASEADTPSNMSSSSQTVDSGLLVSRPVSLPPLYKKLANIVSGKPADQVAQPVLAKLAARRAAAVIPSELAGHSRYEVLEPLGAGGMGAVYKAKHRLMDRTVAIKIVNPLLVSQPGAVERFIREVKAAAQLVDPHIVTAYDAEKIGEMHVLVMEYVEGETLGELLHTQGVLQVAQACDYVRQTALELQHALDRGMVHRDIKPLNLMLTKQGSVKILDFGLARFVSEVGTRIEVPKWHEWGPSPTDQKKKLYQGFHFGSPNGLRLSGFEFRLPPVPADAEYAVAVDLYSTGDVIVESCQVRFHRDVLAGLSDEEKQQVGRFIGLNVVLDSQGAVKTGRFLVQDNLIDGKVQLHGGGPVYATVQRNWIRAPMTDSLDLPNYAGSEGTVRHNVIQGANGIALRSRESENAGAKAGRYVIANNAIDVVHCPVWAHAVAAAQEKDRPDRQTVCRAVTIQNNITRSQSGSGLELHADDLKAMTGVWKIGHNSFSATPKHVGTGSFPVFAEQPTDLIVAGPFLSDDPQQADYLRIAADGRLAAGGVGGNLPSYFGAFPPGPAPKDGDWFTRLREGSRKEKQHERPCAAEFGGA